MRGSIIGPYVLGRAGPHLDQLRRLQPRVAVMFEPDAEDVRRLREACPETKLIGRIYRDDGEVQARILADPQAAARWADELITGHPAFGLIDYWHIENEVCQFWDQLPALNQYSCARMALAVHNGYRCGIGVHSVGQLDMPEHDRLALWRIVFPSMRQARDGGHVYLVHMYGWPTLWGPEERGGADWFIHRLEHQVLPRLPAEFASLQWVVSEYGLDGLISGPVAAGWERVTTAARYVSDLVDIASYVSRFWPQVAGYCVYCLGSNGDPQWHSYDIGGEVLAGLAWELGPGHVDVVDPDKPEGGEVDDMDGTRVFDLDGTERDEAWLSAEWDGCRVLRANAEPGQLVWRLVAVYVTEGPALIKAEVRGEEGEARAGQPVALTYPLLERPDGGLQDLRGSGAQDLWSARGAALHTNNDGMAGFGLGGAYGPLYHVWVVSAGAHADCLTLTGMRGGTNHRGPLHAVWQLKRVTEGLELLPEDESATDPATLAEKVRWWMEEYARSLEQGQIWRAKRILYSLIRLDDGLLYRLENALKARTG